MFFLFLGRPDSVISCHVIAGSKPGPRVIECSTKLNIRFQLLRNTKILTDKDFSCFKTVKCCIYPGYKC